MDSAIHVHVSISSQPPLPSRLRHNTQQSRTVFLNDERRDCQLRILYLVKIYFLVKMKNEGQTKTYFYKVRKLTDFSDPLRELLKDDS